MSSGRIAATGVALYLYLSGAALALLSHHWEGLPLGPRDGQAFMGVGLLGSFLLVLGVVICATLAMAYPNGRVPLVVSLVGTFLIGWAISATRVIDLSALILVPGALFFALLGWPARSAAARILAGSGVAAVAFAALAYVSGPAAWMTRGVDGAVLVIWPLLAAGAAAVAGIRRRRAG